MHLRSLFLYSTACLAALAPAAPAAPPTLTYLFPAGAQRGQTVLVSAGGTFERWPVQAWADGKALTVTPAKEKGKLSVSVAADALPGTCWMRLYDEQGASSLRPFLVGTLPEVAEQEANDDPKKPQVLASSAVVVNGRLDRAGDVDCFALALKKGQTLVASMEAHRILRSPMDAVLQVVSPDGFVLAQNNDDHELDPQIAFTVPSDGTYLVRTFAFPATPDASIRFAGAEQYVYRLTFTTGGFIDHAYPLAVARSNPGRVKLYGWNLPAEAEQIAVRPVDDSDVVTLAHPQLGGAAAVRLVSHPAVAEQEPNDPQHPQPIELPVTISGRIDSPGDVDVFVFSLKKGRKVVFRVESRVLGSTLDAALRLTDAAGKTVAQAEGVTPRAGAADAELAFTPPGDGTYHLTVRDLHGEGSFRHVYRLSAVFAEPEYDLTLAADRFTLTAGAHVDIPVTVDKRDGMDRDVEVVAVALPAGVTSEPVVAKGAGKLVVGLRLTAKAGAASGAFQVVGRMKIGSELQRKARASLPELNTSTSHIWVTIAKPAAPASKKP